MQLPVSRDQSSVATSAPVLPHAEPVVSNAALTDLRRFSPLRSLHGDNEEDPIAHARSPLACRHGQHRPRPLADDVMRGRTEEGQVQRAASRDAHHDEVCLNIVRFKNAIATFLAILAVPPAWRKAMPRRVSSPLMLSVRLRTASAPGCFRRMRLLPRHRRPETAPEFVSRLPRVQTRSTAELPPLGLSLHRPTDPEPSFARQARRPRSFRSRHHSYAALRSPSEPTFVKGRVRRHVFIRRWPSVMNILRGRVCLLTTSSFSFWSLSVWRSLLGRRCTLDENTSRLSNRRPCRSGLARPNLHRPSLLLQETPVGGNGGTAEPSGVKRSVMARSVGFCWRPCVVKNVARWLPE